MAHRAVCRAQLIAWLLATLPGSLGAGAEGLVALLDPELPKTAAECTAERAERLVMAAARVDLWLAEQVWEPTAGESISPVRAVQRLVAAKKYVDTRLEDLLALRREFATLVDGDDRPTSVRAYLAITSQMIDLSGRLRYTLLDAVLGIPYDPGNVETLLELLSRERVSIGAYAMAYLLFEPPSELGIAGFPESLQRRALDLMAVAGTAEVVPVLAEFIRQESATPELALRAAEALREIGVPQLPPPDPVADAASPAITPPELQTLLANLPVFADRAAEQRRQALLAWLDGICRHGFAGDAFRIGRAAVRPGDWLLMRNPSPYNRFTDLSPGLFTHVGVVAVQSGTDGVARFVIVDVPERGDHIPATNVDTYLARTVHYVFLRHADADVAARMGRAAASLIGKESLFDLNFRTDRVAGLRGRLDDTPVIHTYCAGLLLLCAQETDRPRAEFFPIVERTAGGHCAANLAKIGLSIGDDFVSPTGALFSPHLQVVARREPMYSADREVKERIYDYFARRMVDRPLNPAPDLYQTLRQQVAAFARKQPMLARALARAHNVNEKTDLVAAAKAASVVETLDDIADRQMDEFLYAMQAMWAVPEPELEGLPAEVRARVQRFRDRHAELYRHWSEGLLSPRDLRLRLLDDYTRRGHGEIDQKFFAADAG